MIRILVTILSCFTSLMAMAQMPAWEWAKSAGSVSTDNSFSIAAHSTGSSYVTGQFSASTITFGNITLNGAGSSDIFVVKYDASGNVDWAKSVGGTGYDSGLGIATDSAGNCYVTGAFENTIQFDTITLTTNGSVDIFIAKYNASGSLLWARSEGSSSMDGGSSIAVDRSGNSYITGYYEGNFTFGTNSLTHSGSDDLFVAKYDASGNVLWAKGIGSTGKDWSTDAAVDKSGNLYITGYFNSTSLNFDGSTVNNTGQNDLFIARFTPAGNITWVKNGGGPASEFSLSMDVDENNNSYITGYYTSTVSFGSTTLTTAGGDDVFIAKYDSTGNPVWAKSVGGATTDAGYAIATDADGNSYITGMFASNSIVFGSTTFNNTGTSPYSDVYVTKYDRSGNVVWAKNVGSTGMDVGNGISLDEHGNCYVTGTFNANINFDNTTLNLVGGDDLFVAKIPTVKTSVPITRRTAGYRIYPNPLYDRLYITGSTPTQVPQAVRISDVTGRAIITTTILSEQLSIDVRSWPAGTYFVRIGDECSSIVKH